LILDFGSVSFFTFIFLLFNIFNKYSSVYLKLISV